MCLEPVAATGWVWGRVAFDPCRAARLRAAQREKLERVGRGKKKVDSDEDSENED